MTDSPLKAIRRKCLDCQGNGSKAVAYCASDGENSLPCALWPSRFGHRPASIRACGLGDWLDRDKMPEANSELEKLPRPPRGLTHLPKKDERCPG